MSNQLNPELEIIDRFIEHGLDLPEVPYPKGFTPIDVKGDGKKYLIAVRHDRALVRKCQCSYQDGRHALSCSFTGNSLSNTPARNHWREV